MFHGYLFSAMFIPHEDRIPRNNIHPSTQGVAGGACPPLRGLGGSRDSVPRWGFDGEAPKGKISL
jgi:hypothetical protein